MQHGLSGYDTCSQVNYASAAMLMQASRKRSAVPHCGKIGFAGHYVVCCKHRSQRLENLRLLKVVFYFPFAQ